MPRKSLIIVVVVAVVGMAAILWIVNRGERADHFSLATEHLSSVESFAAGVSVDFLYDPAGTEDESGMTIPLRISGLSEVGYRDDGTMMAVADLSVDAGEPATQVMTIAARLPEDGTLYSMLDGLPPELGDVIDVVALNGSWFSLGEDALQTLLPWSAGEGEGSVLSEDGPLLLPGKRFDDTIMEGVAVAHYEALVDKSGLTSALVDLTGGLQGRTCTEEEKSAIAAYVAGREYLAEAWIDKRHDRFYLIKIVAMPTDDTDASPVAFTIKFTGFDKPISVETPEDARPLSTVLAKLLRGSASSVGEEQ